MGRVEWPMARTWAPPHPGAARIRRSTSSAMARLPCRKRRARATSESSATAPAAGTHLPADRLVRRMTAPTPEPSPTFEVTADARAALLAHVARDPIRHRFVRIHVGRG